MGSKLSFKRFFAYTEDRNKSFDCIFGDGINIVHGKNTSGKSTLFLSLLYTFGINDNNSYLKSLLSEKVIFRLDAVIDANSNSEKVTLIRDGDTLYFKRREQAVSIFHGISANNSAEHIKLKEFLNGVFGFTLQLESSNELKAAPIETMFLPYYISQSVGWVYLRKSFASLDFFKNFKTDYLDYYLGIEPANDRVRKHTVQSELSAVDTEISLISKFENENESIQLTKLADEEFLDVSKSYIEEYSGKYKALTKKETEFVIKSNELTYLEDRKSVLVKVSRNHKHQNPLDASCPVCSQTLPFGISEAYEYLQEENDTTKELQLVKSKINDVQAELNSLNKFIAAAREEIGDRYDLLKKHAYGQVTFDSWMHSKATVELISNVHKSLGELTSEKVRLEAILKDFPSESAKDKLRFGQAAFTEQFKIYLNELGVKAFDDERYLQIYRISSFPYSGVELHKTIMAYHFAFNKTISDTYGIHRLPFLLDAIFKEDLDDETRKLILKFISNNAPSDTQTIISIAQSEHQPINAENASTDYFGDNANLIEIGDGILERSFLTSFKAEQSQHAVETEAFMENIN
jgi:hypothetical protein